MRSFTSSITRLLFLVHRYLGIGIGLLMAVWCLSGIVMMYVDYPDFPESERIGSLPALDWNLDGRCVLRLSAADQPARLIDLETGDGVGKVSARSAATVATSYVAHSGMPSDVPAPIMVARDQWTVSGEFNKDRPLYRFDLRDPEHTQLYISSTSGKAVQVTTAPQRFWNWLGAVPHWLYPTVLRQHVAAWSQLVIWTSLIGVFLTLTGLYIGIRQYWLGRHSNLISPYRGIMFLHHVPGLLFGVLLLTWVGSGLLSMNPWGALESVGVGEAFHALYGEAPQWRDVQALLRQIHSDDLPGDTVSISSALLNGKAFAVATGADGRRKRYGVQGGLAGLSDAEIDAAAARLGNASAGKSWILLKREDEYHYSHGRQHAQLPAIRITVASDDPLDYYLDPVTGKLIDLIDTNARWYRWLHYSLHRLDFQVLRSRPLWDVVLLVLLIGASTIALTGTWIGIRRLTRKR
jgi:hypothetical protein